MTNVYSREFHTLCSSENKNGNRKLYSIDFCLSKFRHVFFFVKRKGLFVKMPFYILIG